MQAVAIDRQVDRGVERDAATGVEFELLAPDWRAEGLGNLLVRLPRSVPPAPWRRRDVVRVSLSSRSWFTDGRC